MKRIFTYTVVFVTLTAIAGMGWLAGKSTFLVPALSTHVTSTAFSRQSAATVAQNFFSLWSSQKYAQMYDMLSSVAKHKINTAAFVARYRGIEAEAGISSEHSTITASQHLQNTADVTFTTQLSTTSVGPIVNTGSMSLLLHNNQWRVNWTPDLIFPGLGWSYRVHLFTTHATRGAIVDRDGAPLATTSYLLPIGVIPKFIKNESSLVDFLGALLHESTSDISKTIHVKWAVQNPADFVPVGAVSASDWSVVPLASQVNEEQNGLVIQRGGAAQVAQRTYPGRSLAGSLLGYVSPSDNRGVAGIEAWADSYLRGEDGERLVLAAAPTYTYIHSVLKQQPRIDGDTVQLTIDRRLQAVAERALGNKIGAIVALHPADGAVLAMASSPEYDPNQFAHNISSAQYQALVATPGQPFVNKATEGQFPLGSVFKMVTAGAAMEHLGDTINTTLPCPGMWYGLGQRYAKANWNSAGQGFLTMHEAIVQSCDPFFYQTGLYLDLRNADILPTYATSWGFGSPTGIAGVREAAGLIPSPAYARTRLHRPWVRGDAVDLAIGQGDVEVTPLQVAQMIAALANKGIMFRPRVVQAIADHSGKVLIAFPPVVSLHLPLSSDHLQQITDAMRGVVSEPLGTANLPFIGFQWPVAGKTGTAQTGDGRKPDAWFVAFAPYDHPTIALAVLVEHGGEGAVVSAPLARQVLQAYFSEHR